jgi:hypothetical protein
MIAEVGNSVFFMDAHAVREVPMSTRDTARIRTYFPTVALPAPHEI